MNGHFWAPVIQLALYALTFAVACERAGQPRGRYSPVAMLFGIAAEAILLWWGGFFAGLGWGAP